MSKYKAHEMRDGVLKYQGKTADSCEDPMEMYQMIKSYEELRDELIEYFNGILEDN